jgi:hypothetical protein
MQLQCKPDPGPSATIEERERWAWDNLILVESFIPSFNDGPLIATKRLVSVSCLHPEKSWLPFVQVRGRAVAKFHQGIPFMKQLEEDDQASPLLPWWALCSFDVCAEAG